MWKINDISFFFFKFRTTFVEKRSTFWVQVPSDVMQLRKAPEANPIPKISELGFEPQIPSVDSEPQILLIGTEPQTPAADSEPQVPEAKSEPPMPKSEPESPPTPSEPENATVLELENPSTKLQAENPPTKLEPENPVVKSRSRMLHADSGPQNPSSNTQFQTPRASTSSTAAESLITITVCGMLTICTAMRLLVL